MHKLLNAYTMQPTDKNADNLVQYAIDHPMALCTVTGAERETYNRALIQIAEEE